MSIVTVCVCVFGAVAAEHLWLMRGSAYCQPCRRRSLLAPTRLASEIGSHALMRFNIATLSPQVILCLSHISMSLHSLQESIHTSIEPARRWSTYSQETSSSIQSNSAAGNELFANLFISEVLHDSADATNTSLPRILLGSLQLSLI